MKNTIKIVILAIIGFAVIVYLTLPNNFTNKNTAEQISLDTIPKYYEVVNGNPYTKLEALFKLGEEKYIIVLNHDSLAVFKELYKKTNKNIVLVANISNTPWIIKQMAVNGELEKMYKNSKIPLVNDSDGSFINSLNLNDNQQNRYFVFKLDKEGNINKATQDSVKMGALEKGLSEKELDDELNKILKNL